MLDKEFVPYQEALELKKLEFNERCLGHYWENLFYFKTTHSHPSTMPNSPESCLAPTFSQAFRFFREKHTLYHDIRMFGDWDKPQFSYIVSGRTMTNPAHMWHYEDENSYEEAELACLRKLIKIVKNK